MTRIEHERLIERYLAGEMAPVEEQEFFIQVAANDSLRQTLKAYRVVENALRKHRDLVPPLHADARARLISMLNVPAAAQPHGSPAAHTLAAGGAAGRFSVALRWLMSAKGFGALLGTTLLGVAAFVMTSSPEPPPAATSPVTPAHSATPRIDRSTAAPTTETPGNQAEPTVTVEPREGLDQRPAVQQNMKSTVTDEPRRTPSRATETPRSTTNTLRTSPSTPAQPQTPAVQSPTEPRTTTATTSTTNSTTSKPNPSTLPLNMKGRIGTPRSMDDTSGTK